MPLKSIIIENEKAATKLLSTILRDYCQDVDVEGSAVSITDGFKLIQNVKPDLVFLDIELDDGKSFELLDMLEHRDFRVLFTTAYDQYALKAFRYDAVDYILKPYTPKTVVAAVSRVQEREKSNLAYEKLQKVLTRPTERISLATSQGIRVCTIQEVLRLEAASSYCTVHLTTKEKIIVSKPLGDIEQLLPEGSFFRVHSSHSVNIRYVKQIVNIDGGYIELADSTQVPLARRRKQEFIEKLKM